MRIGLIGLGEMGSEIGRSFVENGIEVISVYDGRSRTSKERAIRYGIKDALTIENVSKKSDIIISVIPPDKHYIQLINIQNISAMMAQFIVI